MICHVEQLRRCDKQPRTCLAIQDNTALFASPDAPGVAVEQREWVLVVQDDYDELVFAIDKDGETVGNLDFAIDIVSVFGSPPEKVADDNSVVILAYLRAIKRARQEGCDE